MATKTLTAEQAERLPSYYMTNFQTGKLELQALSSPSEWTEPPPFPSGASGLVSTADDYLAFARLLLNKGAHNDARLLSEKSVGLMTTNHADMRLAPSVVAQVFALGLKQILAEIARDALPFAGL